MKYTVIKLKAMKSGKRMAFIHDGKPRSYGRLIDECMTMAGINDHALRDDWIDVADIETHTTRKAAEKSAKEYEEGR
jgi:hypothetical protein